MINLRRLSNGTYRTDDGMVLIRRVTSQRNSRHRTLKEVCWTVQILNYELPMAHESLKDARAAALRWIRDSLEKRIGEFHFSEFTKAKA